jgi:FkbM family methyltransferase
MKRRISIACSILLGCYSLCGTTIYDVLAGHLVFDIGAHRGKMVDQYRARGCRVIAVEPMIDYAAFLRTRYAQDSLVEVVPCAVTEQPGEILLSVCSAAPTITTCSPHWKTGRFADYTWDREYKVSACTLDQLIEHYGMPYFCKIDVEGHEIQVLRGLSKPISYISFEFASEFVQDALICMQLLSAVDTRYRFNIAYGDDPRWILSEPTDAETIVTMIKSVPLQARLWGDIYAILG